jgi:hypothetical protein
VLAAERERRDCKNLIAVLNEPIENNWFSRVAFGKNVAWITTNDWEFYSDVPLATFVAYEAVSNLLLMLVAKRPEDEEWLMREVIHKEETRECISDMCAYKPDISRKIRSGGICEDCRRVLGNRLGEKGLEGALKLLGVIRGSAAAETPKSSAVVSARWLWNKGYSILSRRREETDRELTYLRSGLSVTHAHLARAHEEAAVLRGKRRELREKLEAPGTTGGGSSAREETKLEALELEKIEAELSGVEAEIERLREQ